MSSHRVEYLSTFRGRAGIANGDMLFYATGGLAVGLIRLQGFVGSPATQVIPPSAPSCSLDMSPAAALSARSAVGAPQGSSFCTTTSEHQDLVLPEVSGAPAFTPRCASTRTA
jgi:hypothetical protein